MRTLFAWLLLLAALPALAAEVAGVKFEAETKIDGAGQALVLNGAGLRRFVFFKVYAAGLYLPAKTTSAAEAIAAQGPKRISIRMLRDVDAKEFSDALEKGLRENNSADEMKAIEPRLAELLAIMTALKEAKEGMRIELDWRPGTGTVVVVDGALRGKPIAGEDFYRALLKVWLGEHPVQDDLKDAMLGKKAE